MRYTMENTSIRNTSGTKRIRRALNRSFKKGSIAVTQSSHLLFTMESSLLSCSRTSYFLSLDLFLFHVFFLSSSLPVYSSFLFKIIYLFCPSLLSSLSCHPLRSLQRYHPCHSHTVIPCLDCWSVHSFEERKYASSLSWSWSQSSCQRRNQRLRLRILSFPPPTIAQIN